MLNPKRDYASELIGPHAPHPDLDLCCVPQITCGDCGRPIRPDGSWRDGSDRWRADIDGRGAELACYPEYERV
jgi:hypothetical protein